ncbi:putative heterokaryon incompatibility protein [Neofusicoccum parvum]|uniref:Heterokaryon incompatibility protein n=2 Tax=Neofusicoccum parvum TaxID=310453 RepID=A0ACB5RW54_9PEZI|nr:putative heterokaryon incompatibility protein [Neofusicoccum parvum UCRNP2]GME24744.1 putative heterokaryon incompatibility protein [Neofusicoccum parvum]GME37926.1 putative heterokaryon incompatibility protein [Neofusicoccum parvum]
MFRRFVIVKTDTKISQQIKTYENKATTRPDVRNKQHEHAIIYTGVEPPKPLKGESNLQDPIEADAESQATYLSPFARINYGESHEIQHTEKVYNLGQLPLIHTGADSSNKEAYL